MQRAFAECRRVLQPDGMFLASMLGGDTLFELRNACHLAEEEREGGFSLRTSPLVHVRCATTTTPLLFKNSLCHRSFMIHEACIMYEWRTGLKGWCTGERRGNFAIGSQVYSPNRGHR